MGFISMVYVLWHYIAVRIRQPLLIKHWLANPYGSSNFVIIQIHDCNDVLLKSIQVINVTGLSLHLV